MKEKQNNPKGLGRFINAESLSGLLLIAAAAIAVIWANSAFGDSYKLLWEKTYLTIGVAGAELSKPLYYWINDGLMAIFFFVIGLEIKREVMVGELSNIRKASLPIAGAIGGILLPALIYVGFNLGDPDTVNGWGIPMATDIAFSLGILALLGSKVPTPLKVFLTALAIVDDIGAIMAIAFFYTDHLSLVYLGISVGFLGVLALLNYLDVRNITAYLLIGIIGVWLPMLLSGVHATIAGVLLATTIPAKRKIDTKSFVNRIKSMMSEHEKLPAKDRPIMLSGEQLESIDSMKEVCEKAESPLQRIEGKTHKLAIFYIMPLFALANSGINFSAIEMGEVYVSPVGWGVFLGLLIGKPLGISLLSFISVKSGIAEWPRGIDLRHIAGVGLLAGIGFTMSLFITDLAFRSDQLMDVSKIAIFGASLLSGIIGYTVLNRFLKKH